MKKWKTISAKVIADFIINEVELPTGKRIDYITVNYPPSVGIVALTKEDKVVMVGQYRYAIDEYSWEIPTGMLKEGESVEQAAKRELEEETAFVAGKIERICSFHPSNAASNQVIHLCLAKGTLLRNRELKHDEPIEKLMKIKLFDFDSVLEMILNNQIKDAATIIGLFFLLNKLERSKTSNK